jgi:hypothetical protein
MVLLLANLGDVAVRAILLPGVVPAYSLAAVGLETLRGWVARAAPGWLAICAAGCVATLIPVMHGANNFAFNNHHEDTYYTNYFRELFERLPPHAGFIDEGYTVNSMTRYQVYSTGRRDVLLSIGRDPGSVGYYQSRGVTLFAFDEGRAALDGLATFRPIVLSGPQLEEHCRALPTGRVVVLAGSASNWPESKAIGMTGASVPRCRAIVVAVRGAGPPFVTPAGTDAVVKLRVGSPLGVRGHLAPVNFRVELHGSRSTFFIDNQLVSEAEGGVGVVEFGTKLEAAYALQPEAGMRTPLDMRRFPLYRLENLNVCTDFADEGWMPLADAGREGRLVGRLAFRKPESTQWQIYFASTAALPVRIGDLSAGNDIVPRVEQFTQQPRSRVALEERLREDGLHNAGALLAAPVVTRVDFTVESSGTIRLFELYLGGRPDAAFGRVVFGDRRGSTIIGSVAGNWQGRERVSACGTAAHNSASALLVSPPLGK